MEVKAKSRNAKMLELEARLTKDGGRRSEDQE